MKLFSCFSKPKVKEPPDRTEYMRQKMDKERLQRVVKKEEKKEEDHIRKRYHDFVYLCNGYFAKVYKAKDIDNNPVAIKRMNIKNNPRFYKIAKRECALLQHLNSPHIIKLKDAFVNEDYLYMILPLYKMDLFEYIPEVIGKPNKIFKILLGISKGLAYLHDIQLMHGDIKPENIMLTDKLEPIIIDLGLTKSYNVSIEQETLLEYNSFINNETNPTFPVS